MTTKFELNKEQDARFKSWREKHREVHANGVRDCSGAWLRFTFMPTGVGDNVEVECIWCPGVKLNLSLDDFGEFIYNEDGSKNGW